MQQHRLHPAGDLGVAKRHVDGRELVPDVEIDRARPIAGLLAGQRLPYRRPFGARRRHDVVDPEIAQRFQDRFAAVAVVFQNGVSPKLSGFGRVQQFDHCLGAVPCPNRGFCGNPRHIMKEIRQKRHIGEIVSAFAFAPGPDMGRQSGRIHLADVEKVQGGVALLRVAEAVRKLQDAQQSPAQLAMGRLSSASPNMPCWGRCSRQSLRPSG